MEKVLCTICLLLISGCAQTSSTSSGDWPENWDYEESLSSDTGPTAEEIEKWLYEQAAKEAKAELEWKRKMLRQANAPQIGQWDEPNPITLIEVGPTAGYSSVSPGIPYELTPKGRRQSHLTELEKLNQWVQNSLASGAVHSINVEYNEVRMDPIPWSLVPIESKRVIIQCFSRYFDLKGSTGRVTIRSKYSDEKLASYSIWTGVKIYK